MLKKNLNSIIFIFIILSTLFVSCSCSTEKLEYLDDNLLITHSDTYSNMTAVVATNGNCYIRGNMVNNKTTFGVDNVKKYNKQYDSLDVSLTDKFVQIYSGKDAKSIELSQNGGTIITLDNKVYIFTDMNEYKTPLYFCENAVCAKLLKDKVYILTPKGDFGYRTITAPNDFILLKSNILQFRIMDLDYSTWILTNDNQLLIYSCSEIINKPDCLLENIASFDAMCLEFNSNISKPLYSFGYITQEQKVFYYKGYGLPEVNKTTEISVKNENNNIAVYSRGVITIDKKQNAYVYGNDLLENHSFSGELIAKDVVNISTSIYSINIASNSSELISCGKFPSSKFIFINDIIQPRRKTIESS